MIKVIDYDPSITRCDPPKKIRYDRTDFIADTEADISAMNSSNSEYLNYPAGSFAICLGNGKMYILNAECTEYLEFKDGGSTRTLANLSRSSANCSVSVTVDGEAITDGKNALSIGSTATITATADDGYTLSSLKVNGSDFTSGSTLTVSGDVVIEAVAEEASVPSGVYEWDGVVDTSVDISLGENAYAHKVSDDVLTKPQLIGATVTVGENTATLTDEFITVEGEISVVNGVLWSGTGTLDTVEIDGTYFFSNTETPVHTKLTLAE